MGWVGEGMGWGGGGMGGGGCHQNSAPFVPNIPWNGREEGGGILLKKKKKEKRKKALVGTKFGPDC